MGSPEQQRRLRVDAWLDAGGVVLASSERAARGVSNAFESARRAEGRTAWETPAIFSWESWVRERWLERSRTGVMLLNPLQEQTLWERVIGKSQAGRELLHATRLATAAQQAYRLLAGFAPEALRSSARSGWAGDAATFSAWMADFDARCRGEAVISSSRIALELVDALVDEAHHNRPPLLLIGFDRLTRTQRSVLDAWGKWETDEPEAETATPGQFVSTSDATAEMAACVAWLRRKLAVNPKARLMVVTPGLHARRGELERALLDAVDEEGKPLEFEFSLGVPLGRLGAPRAALMLLGWLHSPLSEAELDWLLTSGHCVLAKNEETSLAQCMRGLRQRGLERPEWPLEVFLDAGHRQCSDSRPTRGVQLPASWTARMQAARDQLHNMAVRQSPMDWARIASLLLESMGWPGFRPESSVEFQARKRWNAVLDNCASLGFDGSMMDWGEFVSAVGEAVAQTIFSAESTDAAVQVTEPLEAAGQLADGIWFLGAHEENWPGRGSPHPLLPIGLQREAEMPHASPQADWALTGEATARLLASAEEVVFSYPRQGGESELRPSRLVVQRLGDPLQLEEVSTSARQNLSETFADEGRVPFVLTSLRGGAATLTRQSLCPFQAFAMARLGGDDWEAAEVGLNAKQRGQLLHEVLHRVWGGAARGGISTSTELAGIGDVPAFVAAIVEAVMQENLTAEQGQTAANRNALRFPSRFLKLEAERLTRLVVEWLGYERSRLPFRVESTEVTQEVTVAGITMRVRLDRVDELPSGSKLIVDYKSSNVGPSAWRGDRPDDVQLPLYATYAVLDHLEGLVFGRVRPADVAFCGRVRGAKTSLRADLGNGAGLVKDALTDEQLAEWRSLIERLGEDFVAGRAEADPKDRVKTCSSCHLHAVCRIDEQEPGTLGLEDDDEDGAEELYENSAMGEQHG